MNAGIYAGGVGLTLLALLFIVVPLLKYRKETAVGIVLSILVIAFPAAVAAIYLSVTTNQGAAEAATDETASQVPPVAEMIHNLAERMRTEPTLEGLVMLGTSYLRLQRYPEAVDAWHQAWEITEGKNAGVSVGYAEALVLADRGTLTTSAVDLLEFALQEQPNNAKANWYGGLSAAARGNDDLAIQRWTVVLKDPALPPDARMALQQQMASMGAAPVVTGTAIDITVSISPELGAREIADNFLFVVARDVNQPRPPMAVRRLKAVGFPLKVTLSDADSMVPGRSLGDVEELEVIARISMSGNPIAASGDLYGETLPEPADNGKLKADILINSVVD